MCPVQGHWSFVIRFIYELDRSLAFRGASPNYLFGYGRLRRRDDRNFLLDDPCFFARDFIERIAEPFLMIEINRRDDRDIRLDSVRGVEPSTQTGFQNNDVDLGPGKIFERERSRDFKKCWMRLPIVDQLTNGRETVGNRVLRNHLAVHADAFAKGNEGRGGEEAAAITLCARDRQIDTQLVNQAPTIFEAEFDSEALKRVKPGERFLVRQSSSRLCLLRLATVRHGGHFCIHWPVAK